MFSLVAHNLISVNEKQKSSGLRTLPKLLNSTFYSRSYSAAAAKSLQMCPTLCDPIDGTPTRLPSPWYSPSKNTGVGCHFLLQCMKVKSETEVAQLCPTLRNPMDCSPPGSSIHGIFQAGVLEWGAKLNPPILAHPISKTHLQDHHGDLVL